MQEIIRQTEGWARQAVHDMADGKASKALAAFAERGQLFIAGDKPEARAVLMEAWKKEGIAHPENHLILAATNQDAAMLNHEAQALRKQKGALGLASLKASGEEFHIGDRLVFTKNAAPRGIRNGQLGLVENLSAVTRILEVRLDSGRLVSVPLDEYDHVKLGYAVTTHKSQGMTTRNAYILTDESMQDKELSYVQTSRARGVTRLFTTEMEAGPEHERLSRLMSQSHQKRLATDLQEQEIQNRAAAHALALQKQQQMGSQNIRLTI
jgi:ATP-dependent exoDNAse (exonuclease V) alpha subunit